MHLWQVSTEYVVRHFAAVDLILINPYCKLRKLFTMKHRPLETFWTENLSPLSGEPISRNHDFPADLSAHTIVMNTARVDQYLNTRNGLNGNRQRLGRQSRPHSAMGTSSSSASNASPTRNMSSLPQLSPIPCIDISNGSGSYKQSIPSRTARGKSEANAMKIQLAFGSRESIAQKALATHHSSGKVGALPVSGPASPAAHRAMAATPNRFESKPARRQRSLSARPLRPSQAEAGLNDTQAPNRVSLHNPASSLIAMAAASPASYRKAPAVGNYALMLGPQGPILSRQRAVGAVSSYLQAPHGTHRIGEISSRRLRQRGVKMEKLGNAQNSILQTGLKKWRHQCHSHTA